MQLISFTRDGQIRSGGTEGVTGPSMTRMIDLNAADPRLPADMLQLLRGGDELLDLARHVIQGARPEMWLEIAGSQLLAPVPNPGKLICIGLNYRDHAAEAGLATPAEPVVFAKLSNTVNGPYSPIRMPRATEQIDYEGELGVVLGKTCKGVKEADALEYVAGYLAVNDVSARDVQHRNGQWVLGKSPDGFAPDGAGPGHGGRGRRPATAGLADADRRRGGAVLQHARNDLPRGPADQFHQRVRNAGTWRRDRDRHALRGWRCAGAAALAAGGRDRPCRVPQARRAREPDDAARKRQPGSLSRASSCPAPETTPALPSTASTRKAEGSSHPESGAESVLTPRRPGVTALTRGQPGRR